MGPRIASMRHLNIDMAPALTESSQSHDFGLPTKHKPLLTLHFSPSVLSKPMDELTSPDPEVIKDTFNGLAFSSYKFSELDSEKVTKPVLENANETTMSNNGGEECINMGHTENKVESEMEHLLNNAVLLDVLKDAIKESTEPEQVPSSQNSEEKFGQVLFDNVDVTKICSEGAKDLAENLNTIGMGEDALSSRITTKDISENLNAVKMDEDSINNRIIAIEQKKETIERRLNSLLKRTYRIHTRLIGTHAGSEISCVLDGISQSYLEGSSDSSVQNLMQSLKYNIQQHQLFTCDDSYFGSKDAEKTDLKPTPASLVKLNPEYQQSLENVSGHLHSQLKAVQNAIDSDATASSSEAESCDELQSFSNSHQLELPTQRRASWRWNKERTSIGGKWSWLLSQIGDCDYRLRDYQHQQKKYRACRGNVVLSESSSSALTNGSINGFHGPLPTTASQSASESDSCSSCARTRAFERSVFKKRKLYRMKDFRTHKKVNVPVSVRCGCTPPRAPCILCMGRTDPTKPREELKLCHKGSKVALVDSTYQPNSSFTTDVSRRVHLEAVMCTSWWQHRNQPFTLKQRKLLSSTLPGATPNSPEKSHAVTSLKKHTNNLPVPLISELAKSKRKYTRRRKSFVPPSHSTSGKGNASSDKEPIVRPTRPKRSSVTQHWNHLLDDEGDEDDEPMEESEEEFEGYQMSPEPSPSNTGKEFRTRRRESSYDIDNIVIPYSVAATTRVEVLHYKEIQTPKWRFIDKVKRKNGDLVSPAKVSSSHLMEHPHIKSELVDIKPEEEDEGTPVPEFEDLRDETFRQRHEKYEIEERKKFRSYLVFPFNKSRVQKRTDSRAESSGANTPDAQSPKHQPETEGVSPLTSPPIPAIAESSSELLTRMKRRSTTRSVTVSESSSREDQRCASPESADEVSPYSPLQFPLTDEKYDALLKEMPPGHPSISERNYSYEDNQVSTSPEEEKPESPGIMSDSGDSNDPDDPEWTFESTKPASERYPKKYFEY